VTVCIVDSAAIYIMVVNLEILFVPLHRSSPFIGELRCKAIQMEHGPYIAERTQNAVYIVRCLQGCQVLIGLHGYFVLNSRPFCYLSRPQNLSPLPLLRPLIKLFLTICLGIQIIDLSIVNFHVIVQSIPVPKHTSI
jgi:hypothetical protein